MLKQVVPNGHVQTELGKGLYLDFGSGLENPVRKM